MDNRTMDMTRHLLLRSLIWFQKNPHLNTFSVVMFLLPIINIYLEYRVNSASLILCWFVYRMPVYRCKLWSTVRKRPLSLAASHGMPQQDRCTSSSHSLLYRYVCVCNIFNSLRPSDAYMLDLTRPSFGQIMAWRRKGVKPLSERMMAYCKLGPLGTNFSEMLIKNIFIQENPFQNVIWKMAAILSLPQCVEL